MLQHRHRNPWLMLMSVWVLFPQQELRRMLSYSMCFPIFLHLDVFFSNSRAARAFPFWAKVLLGVTAGLIVVGGAVAAGVLLAGGATTTTTTVTTTTTTSGNNNIIVVSTVSMMVYGQVTPS